MEEPDTTARRVTTVITAHRQLEGAGFAVFRPFPTQGLDMLDPFLMLISHLTVNRIPRAISTNRTSTGETSKQPSLA